MRFFRFDIIIIILALIVSCKKGGNQEGKNKVIGVGAVTDNEWMLNEPYEGVDLGLSVKWGSSNIGAISLADYGNYYAWGELETKSKDDEKGYTSSSYSFLNSQLIKYCTDPEYGTVDGLKTLSLSDDISNVRLGELWRIPLDSEWRELMNPKNCSWTWTVLNGVKGYRVQSNKEGFTDNWIFLPAGGEIDGDAALDPEESGSYWSSSLFVYCPLYAKCIDFTQSAVYTCRAHRRIGKNIRPVYGEPDNRESGIRIGNESFN